MARFGGLQMYRPTFAAILLSGTLLAGGAWAQTAAPAPAAPAATQAGGKFVASQGKEEFRASKFLGVDVYGSEGEKIGDISEVLIDTQGNAKSVVIGVGGFLGIGKKNVALPWSTITWSNDPPPSKSASTTDRPPATGSTGAGTGASGTPMTAGAGAGGAAPRPAATSTRSPAEQAAYNGYPDHAKVQLSKAELESAPEFKYVSDTASGSTAK
jgi:sporulation protein YlmC with PRC-barrel domain